MSAEPTPWLGTIHYRDASGVDVVARAAAWADTARSFDDAMIAHLEAQGAAFLWSEEVHEAINWFTRFGHNAQMAGLARRVDGKTLAALSDPKVGETTNDDDDSYLIIEEIEDVTPLDMQIGAYPKLTAPTALQEALFGQPEPTEAEVEQYGDDVPEMGTYAILDAAKMPYLLTAELSGSGLEYQSLFQGDAQEELGEYAPYIVRLEDGNDFTRKLFTDLDPPLGLWKQELGIFVRSRADLQTLRRHFRKFTRVEDEAGKWYYFRFWEGRTIEALSISEDSRLDLTRIFFQTANSIKISAIVYACSAAVKVVAGNNSKIACMEKANLSISPEIRDSLSKYKKSEDIQIITTRISQNFSERFSEKQKDNLADTVQKSVERFMNKGILRMDSLFLLASWECFYGLNFEEKDKSGRLVEILNSALREEAKMQQFAHQMRSIMVTET